MFEPSSTVSLRKTFDIGRTTEDQWRRRTNSELRREKVAGGFVQAITKLTDEEYLMKEEEYKVSTEDTQIVK